MSPSPTKIGSLSMPWIWTGTPSGQGPNAQSPLIGMHGVEEQRAASARPRLGELLRDHLAEREARVDELGRQVVGGPDAALEDRVEPDFLDEGHALVDRFEGPSVEQVGRVDGVAGGSQLVGERADAGRQPLGVVEEQDLGHGKPPGGVVGAKQLGDQALDG